MKTRDTHNERNDSRSTPPPFSFGAAFTQLTQPAMLRCILLGVAGVIVFGIITAILILMCLYS